MVYRFSQNFFPSLSIQKVSPEILLSPRLSAGLLQGSCPNVWVPVFLNGLSFQNWICRDCAFFSRASCLDGRRNFLTCPLWRGGFPGLRGCSSPHFLVVIDGCLAFPGHSPDHFFGHFPGHSCDHGHGHYRDHFLVHAGFLSSLAYSQHLDRV